MLNLRSAFAISIGSRKRKKDRNFVSSVKCSRYCSFVGFSKTGIIIYTGETKMREILIILFYYKRLSIIMLINVTVLS